MRDGRAAVEGNEPPLAEYGSFVRKHVLQHDAGGGGLHAGPDSLHLARVFAFGLEDGGGCGDDDCGLVLGVLASVAKS